MPITHIILTAWTLQTITVAGITNQVDSMQRCLKDTVNEPSSYPLTPHLERPCVRWVGGRCEARVLDRFYASLVRRRDKVRVALWSDSLMNGALVSRQLAQLWHGAFGDGGPGFVQPGYLTRWDEHPSVTWLTRGRWKRASVVYYRGPNRRFGFGGTRFTLIKAPGRIVFRFRRPVTQAIIHYGTASPGPRFYVTAPGISYPIKTTGKPQGHAFSSVSLSPTRVVRLRLPASGVVLYGTFFESDSPGVVLDTIGLISARLIHLIKADRAMRDSVLAMRRPQLLIYSFGRNEVDSGLSPSFTDRAVMLITRDRQAAGGAECLVLGPTDRMEKKGSQLQTPRNLPVVARRMHDAAIRAGCAYMDLIGLMGGYGAAGQWLHHRPALMARDLVHPTITGGRLLGYMVYMNLMRPLAASCGTRNHPL